MTDLTNKEFPHTITAADIAQMQQAYKEMKQQGTGAVKLDAGKAPMSLLSRTALEEVAQVMAFGAKKYAAHNWRQGFAWSRTLDAASRHLYAFIDGEDKDPESGLSHLAHAMCCLMFTLEFEKTHPELDDRWKPAEPEAH